MSWENRWDQFKADCQKRVIHASLAVGPRLRQLPECMKSLTPFLSTIAQYYLLMYLFIIFWLSSIDMLEILVACLDEPIIVPIWGTLKFELDLTQILSGSDTICAVLESCRMKLQLILRYGFTCIIHTPLDWIASLIEGLSIGTHKLTMILNGIVSKLEIVITVLDRILIVFDWILGKVSRHDTIISPMIPGIILFALLTELNRRWVHFLVNLLHILAELLWKILNCFFKLVKRWLS
uniref:Uncharacterized protein n=1 Tax=Nephroselmis olivacea TaxID=31312 RepID=Q9T3S5_NEPOL|nr:hypothetical protein NeolCp081 [Nephroselmis olivacea]NP_050961.1 hypothetical protein NeolCp156 [Nephroselmis olivacea]AAD54857.1 unknown [Nephroselmis olivacea]AAD54932.1 unknown [Nephroselmis olivacea]